MAGSILIKRGLIFDGSGRFPVLGDILCEDGVVRRIGQDLDESLAEKVIDADGRWVTPGLLDIHTHYDLEVEVDSRLPESVRHGTTTVVMSNCSLGVAFGKQTSEDKPHENPVVDCFARVENISKDVIESCTKDIDWNDTEGYLKHFDDMPLGPNVVPMIPHSMLRIQVMGLEASISRDPSEAEIQEMERLLELAMQQGYVGMSVDLLPLHYLANDPHKNACIPTQHASAEELKRLSAIVRKYDRIWQATPNPDNLLTTLKMFALTSGRLYGKTMRTTATAAMDLRSNKLGSVMVLFLSKLMNSWLFKGRLVFQALAAPFRVYADGVTSPLMEEKPAFRELISIEIGDTEARQKLLDDPAFARRFKEDWNHGREGFGAARIRRMLSIDPETFNRDFDDIYIDTCPYAPWNGKCMQDIYTRLCEFQQSGGVRGYVSEEERSLLGEFPNPIDGEAGLFLALLRKYDREFRWHTTTANYRPDKLKKLLFHKRTLPGFNDSGAHLTNMAFYDGNLRTLQMAAADLVQTFSQAVSRLTREPADLFNLDVGEIKEGKRADIVIIDPEALGQYESEKNTRMEYRTHFKQKQMVNRSDGVVDKVLIAGKLAWTGTDYESEFGQEKYGDVLTSIA